MENHIWVCECINGSDGEIVIRTPLSEEQLASLKNNPDIPETICNNGDIVCQDCGITFGNKPRKHTSRNSVADIENNLE